MRRAISLAACAMIRAARENPERHITQQVQKDDELNGFFDLYRDESQGRLLLEAEDFEEPIFHNDLLPTQSRSLVRYSG